MTDGRDRFVVSLPVLFVDEVLPTLKDTELRVLLIVLRQTHVAGRERASVWITSGELRRRTGRASEAVSAAIDSLSNHGLLLVCDETGKRLATSTKRRCATGRRFYRVNANAFGKSKSDADKSKTIDINTNKHYSLRFSGREHDEMDTTSLSIEQEKARIRERLKLL